MPNPNLLLDGLSRLMGYIVHKNGTTLTANMFRAYAPAATSGAAPVGHLGVATGIAGGPVATGDSSETPVVLVSGKNASGNHQEALAVALADALANPSTLVVGSGLLSFNGTTWDRVRLPLGAALANAMANPTTTQIGANLMSFNGTTWDRLRIPLGAALDDSTANPTVINLGNLPHQFNGTTWERVRGNVEAILLSSASRTATQTGADTVNYNHRGIRVTIDITAAGTGDITVEIQAKDAASGKYITLLSSGNLTTNQTKVLTLYPGLTASANSVANDVLPRVWRIVATANNANAMTYSVGYSLML